MKKLLTALILAAATLPALAVTWVEISKNDDLVFMYDSETLERANDFVKVKTRRVLKDPLMIEGKPFLSNTVVVVFHCTSRTMSLREFEFFADRAGTRSVHKAIAPELDIRPVTPGTYAEDALKMVC